MRKRGTDWLRVFGRDESGCRPAFTLIEVMTALAILALTASSVLYVVNQNVSSAADSARRLEAFQLARENMEKILTAPTVTENVEFGTSELYPDISWRTVVEVFSEPTEGAMWLRAVCTAEYNNSLGETQKIELVHWLTPLTDQQAAKFMEGEDASSLAAEQVIEDAQGAAEYAGVDAGTIAQWIDSGLVLTDDGSYLRYNLDIFVRSKGNPSSAARDQQVHSLEELTARLKESSGDQDGGSVGSQESTDAESGPRTPIDNLGHTDGSPGVLTRPGNGTR